MTDAIEDLPVTLRPFVPFRTWWKVDDAAWVEQRKAEWKRLKKNRPFSDYDAVQNKALARFYVFGEEPPRTEENILHRASIAAMDRFLLTPYGSPEEARRLFEAFSHHGGRRELLNIYMQSACMALNGLPYVRKKVADFAAGVIGDEYRVIEAYIGSPKLNRKEIISQSASSFTERYVLDAIEFITGEYRYGYSYVADTVPYFMSTLRYMEAHDESVTPQLEQLVQRVMSSKEDALNDLQRELVERLRTAFEADDAPVCIKQYLAK